MGNTTSPRQTETLERRLDNADYMLKRALARIDRMRLAMYAVEQDLRTRPDGSEMDRTLADLLASARGLK